MVDNLDRLQEELEATMAYDSKYWRENDAKFRAVAQGVSYEQFEDMVKASHLTPMERKDIVGQGGRKQGLWNSVAKDNSQQRPWPMEMHEGTTEPEVFQLPRNLLELQKAWRGRGQLERLELLAILGREGCGRLFATEVPSDLLMEMVTVLQGDDREGWQELVVAVLGSCALAKRFSLCLQFLSAEEKERVQRLVVRVGDRPLMAAYGVTLE